VGNGDGVEWGIEAFFFFAVWSCVGLKLLDLFSSHLLDVVGPSVGN
jgi:hypothetical protein